MQDVFGMNVETSSPQRTPHSRRRFIQRAGGGVIASALASVSGLLDQRGGAAAEPAPRKKIPVGSNIYGWGQYYERMKKNVNDHLEEVFSALRDAGYDYLEGFLDVKQPENNAKFADRMRANGLRPVSVYTGGRLHEAAKASAVVHQMLDAAEVCQKAGYSIIECNPDPIGREKTEEELKTQISALNEFGAGLKQMGLRLGIHNHTPEMVNKAREFHYNLDQSDAVLVGLCYDVHWVFRGGIGPAEVLKQYGRRVVSWHLRQSRDRIWWEDLAKGDIDYEAVAQFANEHALMAPYTVELAIESGTKITRSVVENHQRSREYVRKAFGV